VSVLIETKADKIFDFFNTLILSLALTIILYPLIFVVSASISDPNLVNLGKVFLWPRSVTFDGYRRIIQDSRIWIGYRNTILYTVSGTLINLIVTIPAAYALSRKDFYGRNIFTALFTFTMFFGGGLIPTYLMIRSFGMLNTIWALILPVATGMWYIIISRTYFQSNIPIELQEAAHIDGCSNTRLLFTIVIPLSIPILMVIALFCGVAHWNSFFSALIYITDKSKYPLQLVLREILILNRSSAAMMVTGEDMDLVALQSKIAEQIKYGVIIVSSAPLLIVYPFIQKHFIKGVMIGAIKG
jgi:putative aldouronate transport system permease protein